MSNVFFTVGPSKVDSKLPIYCREACESGILSQNHRSEAFMELWKTTQALVHQKLEIPSAYTVLVCSSATECWEIVWQSLSQKGTFHIYNGAMGEKWRKSSTSANKCAGYIQYPPQESLAETLEADIKGDVLCLTQTETSNGTQISNTLLRSFSIRAKERNMLLAVDATSSLGAQVLPLREVDICFASVQKGLGLPAGLALLVASPFALQRAKEIAEQHYYNSFLNIYKHITKHQSPYTPNVLGIYLLMRILKTRPSLDLISDQVKRRATTWYTFLKEHTYTPYISSPSLRSHTILVIKDQATRIQNLRTDAKQAGYILSPGYGDLYTSTLRIANFPNLSVEDILKLQKFLRTKDCGR